MDGAGLSGLINGFQQGYSFADDMQRKKKEDARAEQEFAQKKKGWKKADDYDAEQQALLDKYFPRDKANARPADPAPAPAAAAGAVPVAMPTDPSDAQQVPVASAAASPTQPGAASTGAVQVPSEAAPAPAAQPSASVAMAQQGTAPTQPAVQKSSPMSNVNKTLDYALESALIDVRHGKLDGAGLLTLKKMADGMQREKADESIALMNQGRYDEGLQLFNSSGDHTGSKIVNAKDDVFKFGKTEVPTKIVTIQDANGNERVINTAQMLFQKQSIDKVISQAQTDAQQAETGRHNKADEAIATKSAAISAAHLGIAQQGLDLEKQRMELATPAGQIAAKEKALGRPLTGDERETALGVDKLPQVARTQLNSLLKEQDNLTAATNKAMADGTWQPDSAGAKQITEKSALLNIKIGQVLAPYQKDDGKSRSSADPLGIMPGSKTQKAVAKPVTGSGAAKAAAGSKVISQNDGVDVSGDPVLKTLKDQAAQLDKNDPANTQKIIAYGNAKNTRIAQLQEKYGSMTKLTGTD